MCRLEGGHLQVRTAYRKETVFMLPFDEVLKVRHNPAKGGGGGGGFSPKGVGTGACIICMLFKSHLTPLVAVCDLY